MLDDVAAYLLVAPLVAGLVMGAVVALWLAGPRKAAVRVRVRRR